MIMCLFFRYTNVNVVYINSIIYIAKILEARRGAAHAQDCKGERLWVQFQLEEIKYLIY